MQTSAIPYFCAISCIRTRVTRTIGALTSTVSIWSGRSPSGVHRRLRTWLRPGMFHLMLHRNGLVVRQAAPQYGRGLERRIIAPRLVTLDENPRVFQGLRVHVARRILDASRVV